MAGSSAEREIRDATVARARSLMPGARIIHELVVGGCRADVAAVERDRITLFEIKSEKDTLDRLEKQAATFHKSAHATIIVAHEKWFNGRGWFSGPMLSGTVWRYPEPERKASWTPHVWDLPRQSLKQPAPRIILDLMWRAEMVAEAVWHGLPAVRRMSMEKIKDEMAWAMTGRQIAEAVCRQLRARPFPEADPPIIDGAAAITKREVYA